MALIALSAPSGRPAIKAAGTGELEVASGATLLINQSSAFGTQSQAPKHVE